jgi:hypothetical protein
MITEIFSYELVLFGLDAISVIDILKFFVAFFLSYFSRFIFIKFSKQNWLSSYSNSLTFLLLPLISYGVTTIISDNIALSLGLVGALSIVRFRTPVKNPFELITYFYLLSIGIILSVSLTTSVLFVFCVLTIIIISPNLIKDTYAEDDFDLYSEKVILSFTTKINVIETPKGENPLIYKSYENNIYTFRYLFGNFQSADSFVESLGTKNILEYNIEKASIL